MNVTFFESPLVSKAEVQALVAPVCGGGQVMFSLFLAHGIPLGRTLLIDVDVEEFGPNH